MEGDNDTNIQELIKSIRAFKLMLKEEANLWDHTNRSKTSEEILKYDVGMYVLQMHVEDRKFKACLSAIERLQLTAKGINKCFRRKDSFQKRDEAVTLFNRICDMIERACDNE